MIIRWPYHQRYNCPAAATGAACPDGLCPSCGPDGAFSCVRCGAVDDEIATECPGRLLEPIERIAIRNGHLDFVGGGWVARSDLATLTIGEVMGQEWYRP